MPPPDHSFGDPERSQLIEQIWESVRKFPTARKVTFRTVRACLWLSDIEMLREMIERNRPHAILAELETVEYRNIVNMWMQHNRDPYSKTPSAASSTSSHTSRSEGGRFGEENDENLSVRPISSRMDGSSPIAPSSSSALPSCKERDNMCSVTKASPIVSEVGHLYPFSMSDQSTTGFNLFWITLRMFWTEERVNQWWAALFNDDLGTEKLENLITLTPTAHKMHTLGFFALEPIKLDPDRKRLTLCFWWLRQGCSDEEVSPIDIPHLAATYNPQDDAIGLMNMQSYRPLHSGDAIVLTTPDPDTHPLPEIRILEMQWIMNRVTAMRGAAEPKDPFKDDSGDESNSEGGKSYHDISIFPPAL